MAIVDMWKEPVVKLINLFSEFLWIQIRGILGLEWSELHFEVVRQTVIIIVHSLFLFYIH